MYLEYIGIFLIIIGLSYLLITAFLARFNNNLPNKHKKELNNFCIIIPARDESQVIEDLLISIKNQTKKVELENIYIIIEDEKDKTYDIARKYKAKVFIRKNLHLKTKGYAIDELLVDLDTKNIFFDAYFIFDADNILDKDYILKMAETYKKGYDIGIGYRNLKNGNDSIIAACSGITFAFLNSNGNETKNNQSRNITLSGTGLYIAGELIKKWHGFPFHSLTEDYELTLYSIKNNLTSFYNKEAMFYDEQPIKYKNTINQRERWIKGYFSNRKKYIPSFYKILKNNNNFGSLIAEITGMKPYILMILGSALYLINEIILIIQNHKLDFITYLALKKIFLILFLAYILFFSMTLFVIYKNKDKININKSMAIKTIIFSPIFFVTYIPCAIRAILTKDIKWVKVEHNRNLNLRK